jgi:hypothetical protein
MEAKMSALRARRFLPAEKFMVLISSIGCVDRRTIVRLEALSKLKKVHPIRDSNRRPSGL